MKGVTYETRCRNAARCRNAVCDPDSCASFVDANSSHNPSMARSALVLYLAHFLAALGGFTNTVTTENREQAKSMADDILTLLGENRANRRIAELEAELLLARGKENQ